MQNLSGAADADHTPATRRAELATRAQAGDAIRAAAADIVEASQQDGSNIAPLLVQAARARLAEPDGHEHGNDQLTQSDLGDAVRVVTTDLIGASQEDGIDISQRIVLAAEASMPKTVDRRRSAAPPTKAQLDDAISIAAVSILAASRQFGTQISPALAEVAEAKLEDTTLRVAATEILDASQQDGSNVPPILVQVARARLAEPGGHEHGDGHLTQSQLHEAVRVTSAHILKASQDGLDIPPGLVQAAAATLAETADVERGAAPPTKAQLDDAIRATAVSVLAASRQFGSNIPAALLEVAEARLAETEALPPVDMDAVFGSGTSAVPADVSYSFPEPGPIKAPAPKKEQIIRALRSGKLSHQAIAKQLGASRSWVSEVAREM